MEKQILETESKQERIQILTDTCVKSENFTYPKQFTDDEMRNKKDELSQQDISLDNLEKEKKEVVTDYSNQIKGLKSERSHTLQCVRTGMEEVNEQVYLMDDQGAQTMGYYNKNGVLVYQRPLMQDERQLRIIDSLTGTH